MTEAHIPERPIPSMARFIGEDWLGMSGEQSEQDESQTALELAVEEALQLDADLHAVFKRSRSGKKVWEWLWRMTMMQPGFQGHLGLDKGTAMGFAREGQNALVMEIHHRMKRHENG